MWSQANSRFSRRPLRTPCRRRAAPFLYSAYWIWMSLWSGCRHRRQADPAHRPYFCIGTIRTLAAFSVCVFSRSRRLPPTCNSAPSFVHHSNGPSFVFVLFPRYGTIWDSYLALQNPFRSPESPHPLPYTVGALCRRRSSGPIFHHLHYCRWSNEFSMIS